MVSMKRLRRDSRASLPGVTPTVRAGHLLGKRLMSRLLLNAPLPAYAGSVRVKAKPAFRGSLREP
jgi:hypothetical protein